MKKPYLLILSQQTSACCSSIKVRGRTLVDRCITLLKHAYKVLSLILLGRLIGIPDTFLQDWQAGFREMRGCRDNTIILRVPCEKMIEFGESLAVVFVDYSAVFNSISHKFIDAALKEAGASAKVRAICRAIYKAASAFTSVK